jgi:hypothetical protein
MKRWLVAISASFLLFGTAYAAPGDNDRHRPPTTRPTPPHVRPVRPERPQHRPPHNNRPPEHRPPHHRPPHNNRPPHHRPPAHKPPHILPIRPPHHPGWNRPGHRPIYHAPRRGQFWYRNRWLGRLRGPAFHYPHGYSYRRWYAGQSLPLLFLAAPYFFNDYASVGVEAPPPGYVWVRYGPDLVLVNRSTGAIEQVLYGVYY